MLSAVITLSSRAASAVTLLAVLVAQTAVGIGRDNGRTARPAANANAHNEGLPVGALGMDQLPYQTAADTISGVFAALLDKRDVGEALAQPTRAELDAIEARFTSAAVVSSRDGMIAAWNEVVEYLVRHAGALASVGVFLLASVRDATEMPTDEILKQAVARCQGG
ncbi:MAG: hypothetical protein QM628_00335 [Propionicimonas sp.]